MFLLIGVGICLSMNSADATTVTNHTTPIKHVETTHEKVDKLMKKASHYRYSHRYQTRKELERHHCGSCWAMSAYLYYYLKKAKVHTRIIQYHTAYSSRHRSVQYWVGRWINMPYRSYFHTDMFNNTRSSGLVISRC